MLPTSVCAVFIRVRVTRCLLEGLSMSTGTDSMFRICKGLKFQSYQWRKKFVVEVDDLSTLKFFMVVAEE